MRRYQTARIREALRRFKINDYPNDYQNMMVDRFHGDKKWPRRITSLLSRSKYLARGLVNWFHLRPILPKVGSVAEFVRACGGLRRGNEIEVAMCYALHAEDQFKQKLSELEALGGSEGEQLGQSYREVDR